MKELFVGDCSESTPPAPVPSGTQLAKQHSAPLSRIALTSRAKADQYYLTTFFKCRMSHRMK
jgi:hypothetical protein